MTELSMTKYINIYPDGGWFCHDKKEWADVLCDKRLACIKAVFENGVFRSEVVE